MAVILAQVILATDDGIAANFVTNTFHFLGQTTEPVSDDLFDALVDFYDGEDGVNNSIASYLSPEISLTANAHTIKFYDVTTLPAGSPYATYSFGLLEGPTSGNPLVSEACCCLSYKADVIPGGIDARRRGRVYIGPLNVSCASGVPSRPLAAFQNALLSAGERLYLAAGAAAAPWVVYSRASGGGEDSVAPITRAWVDNAFDTQRRRGPAATSRVNNIF